MLKSTHGPRVIPNPGGAAGLFRLDYNERIFARNYREPVLVARAAGVGAKIELARELAALDAIGIDLVARSVNDLIVEGAEPLFFLDRLRAPRLDEALCAALMRGVVEGCRLAGCALLGGETEVIGGPAAEGGLDIAGFAVGVVDLHRAMNKRRPAPGDIVLGLAGGGVHPRGFPLAREILAHAGLDPRAAYPELGEESGPAPTLGETLLTPARIYAGSVVRLDRAYRVKKVITGMAHIAGGGLAADLARCLGPNVDAVIDTGGWPEPPILSLLRRHGCVGGDDARRAFGMGIGYCIVLRPTFAEAAKARLERYGERVRVLGKITRGKGRVIEK